MEDGSSHGIPPEWTKRESGLESLQRQHVEKVSRMEEVSRRKEAMVVELENKKNENPERMKGLDELCQAYNSLKDEVLAARVRAAEPSSRQENKN